MTSMSSRVDITVRVDESEIYGVVRSDDVQASMDELADAALDMQKQLVPVDTGKLRLHLRKQHTEDGTGRRVGAFDVEYAAYVEEGHQTEAGTWVPAQPYIRPSMDAVRRRLANG